MGQIRVVLLFNEENERQREVGEYLKTQKRCKTALITELVYDWMQRKTGNGMETIAVPAGEMPQKSEEEIVQKVKQELMEDEEFLAKLNSCKKDEESEKCASDNIKTEADGLDMDEDLLLAGLSMFENNF